MTKPDETLPNKEGRKEEKKEGRKKSQRNDAMSKASFIYCIVNSLYEYSNLKRRKSTKKSFLFAKTFNYLFILHYY